MANGANCVLDVPTRRWQLRAVDVHARQPTRPQVAAHIEVVDVVTVDTLDKDHAAGRRQSSLGRSEPAQRVDDQRGVVSCIVSCIVWRPGNWQITEPRIVTEQHHVATSMVTNPHQMAIEKSPEFGTM